MNTVLVRYLGEQAYIDVWQAMKAFTDSRDSSAPDEFWVVQHPAVFTQGQAGKDEHLLSPGNIPVVRSDRGGQVTYHGPGQCIIYCLIDIRRRKLGVRHMIDALENGVIAYLDTFGIEAKSRTDAPGVYVEGAKIASLGLRVRKGCTYHGVSFNLAMDLEPFSRINVCGYQDMAVTQLKDFVENLDENQAIERLIDHIMAKLGYTSRKIKNTSY